MNVEEKEIDGQLVTVLAPVTDIKVISKKCVVSYCDASGDYQEQGFSKISFARSFSCWLSEQCN
ncbi:hypothetical protein [Aliivibrio sp. EL58]|uniref:hypothetical protein n=1 Tax=Aliivibrio sp. EL58 TaxID=2107582 RepID=UPI000EFB59A5|nr:hypothetical protein [Aliivibrio sp. EL58]